MGEDDHGTEASPGGDVAGAPAVAPAERRRPRRAPAMVVAAAVVVSLVATVVAVSSLGDGRSPDVAVDIDGTAAPPFDLPEVRDPGVRVSLAALRGTPVVVNFFASTCVPCRTEMPDFQQVADELGPRVAFVGIDHQDGRTGAQELLAETGVRYPAGYDPRGEVARAYGLIGLPTTIFVSADGRIVARRTGAMSRNELRRAIERLFTVPAERSS